MNIIIDIFDLLKTTPEAFIKLNFEVLNVPCSNHEVDGFFLEEIGMKSTPICGKDRQYYSVFSSGSKVELTFNARRSEVKLKKENKAIFSRFLTENSLLDQKVSPTNKKKFLVMFF